MGAGRGGNLLAFNKDRDGNRRFCAWVNQILDEQILGRGAVGLPGGKDGRADVPAGEQEKPDRGQGEQQAERR